MDYFFCEVVGEAPLEGGSVSAAGRMSLHPILIHPAAQCAGSDPQAHDRSIGTFDMPIGHRKGL